jgi:cytoskeletal protein CcmA (bactofilin family)
MPENEPAGGRMQGLDRWRKLFQGGSFSSGAVSSEDTGDETTDDFLPADELEGWVSGSDGLDSHDEDDLVAEPVSTKAISLKKALPEARRIPASRPHLTAATLGEIRSALGPGTLIEGKFTFDSPVRIDGTIRGEVHSSSLLIIGEEGVVEGLMCVGSLIVLGRAKGSIVADESVQIGSSGEVVADIEGGLLAIEYGGKFEGMKKGKLL